MDRHAPLVSLSYFLIDLVLGEVTTWTNDRIGFAGPGSAKEG